MQEIKILESETITDNSIISIISISGVKYIFTEATSFYSKNSSTGGCSVSIHTNLVKL